MNNSIDVFVEFCFKGETFTPSLTIDLDQLLDNKKSLGATHVALAVANGIDTYSYLYEVMQGYGIGYCKATGIAADYLDDNKFDFSAFSDKWHKEKAFTALQSLAEKHLNINNLNDNQALKNCLTDAYQLGKDA